MDSRSQLLEFPDEILILVAANLADRQDLCAFGQVCTRLTRISDYWLYRRLVVRTNDQAKCLLDAVKHKPLRSNLMRELIILPTIENAQNIPNCLSSMPQSMQMLQHLMIEMPWCPGSDSSHESEVLWQKRFSGMFEDSSLFTYVPKPHALQRLVTCMSSISRPPDAQCTRVVLALCTICNLIF